MLKKRKFTILLGIWVVVILTLSLISFKNDVQPVKIPYLDKIVHFVFYFVFTALFFLTLKKECRYVKKMFTIYLSSFFVAFLLGVCIEWLQSSMTTTRAGDWLDVLFNMFGTVVAILFMTIISKKASN